MRPLAALTIFCVGFAGCATEPHAAQKTPAISAGILSSAADVRSDGVRVNLPYVFTRHGVEIRVYSVELSEKLLSITIALQETRGRPVDLDVSRLMQPEESGRPLEFAQYSRDGQTLSSPSPTLHLTANAQTSAVLSYTLTAADAGNTIEIRFPTGKWWSSQGSNP